MENEEMQEVFYLRIITALQRELRQKLETDKINDCQINIILKQKKLKEKKFLNEQNIKENLSNDLTYNNYLIPKTFRSKRKLKKIIRHNKLIENKVKKGYYKAFNDAINIVNKVYKKLCKEFIKVDEK